MIVFAYHTGLITKAPKVCEAIFQEFFFGAQRQAREQSVRAWAVLYALHRATRVCYEPLLSDDDSIGQERKKVIIDAPAAIPDGVAGNIVFAV